ncbi:MAG: NUDIX hydrolase [Chloroflexi bacterium]|nr:NUDIX hydrolase [Chloroflexota bacterium]
MDKSQHQSSQIQKIWETEWFSIEAVPNQSSSGRPYFRLSMNDSVEVIAVTPDKKIILVRQFRPALGISMLELPAGHVDTGESREEAIIRELREETGYVCDETTCLGSFRIAPSRINNTLHFFFGKGARTMDVKGERGRETEVVLVTEDEFNKLILDGKFLEVAGVASYFLSRLKGFL